MLLSIQEHDDGQEEDVVWEAGTISGVARSKNEHGRIYSNIKIIINMHFGLWAFAYTLHCWVISLNTKVVCVIDYYSRNRLIAQNFLCRVDV
jgi:hypothetical protein